MPAILVILYLATRNPPSYYPIAKITLTLLPFVIGLVFVALSRVAANNQDRPIGVLKKLFSAMIVVAAAAGSFRYYSEVLKSKDLLRFVREPRFLDVAGALEKDKKTSAYLFSRLIRCALRGSATTLGTTKFTLTAGLSAIHPSRRIFRSQRFQTSTTLTLWPLATGLSI